MVRNILPNRLKSYTSTSTNNSRSTSPNPGTMKKTLSAGIDPNPELARANGLMLKVVVLKVCFYYLSTGQGSRGVSMDNADGYRPEILLRRTGAVLLIRWVFTA